MLLDNSRGAKIFAASENDAAQAVAEPVDTQLENSIMNVLKNKFALTIWVAGLLATASCGGAAAGVGISLQIGIAPPPQRVEVVPPAHRRGMVWIPGFWGWNGQAYVWVAGHHERERRGYRYIVPAWSMVGNAWVFQPGYWVLANAAPTYVQQAPVPSAPPAQQVMPAPLPSAPPGYVIVPSAPNAAPQPQPMLVQPPQPAVPGSAQ